MKRVHVWITGRVQGVWFRESTKNEAIQLGVRGWVKNLVDGRVEGLFQGADHAVDALVAWCHRGPTSAEVTKVEVHEEQPGDLAGFRVLR